MSSTPATITAFDAKNRLGSLLDRVAAGEELVITRHGQPVARLVPIHPDSHSRLDGIFARIDEIKALMLKNGKKVSTKEIIAWKNEGRR